MNIDLAWLSQQFPDYASFQPIGRGGQKIVFSATHKTDGPVVLKLFHPSADPERALREIEAVRKVGSPRVPEILELGTLQTNLGDVIWVRERRIEGESLRDVLARGALPPEQLLRLALHTLEALATAEQVRIVHRDVKPENIIVGTDGRYWLLDFGLARHLDLTSLTATHGPGVGTAGYAPPEQFKNLKREIDARSDLFALGVTIFECAEGRNPFIEGTRDQMERLRRVDSLLLPPISRRIDGSNEFRDLVLTMTRRRRDQRIATAAEALKWVQEICAREGVS